MEYGHPEHGSFVFLERLLQLCAVYYPQRQQFSVLHCECVNKALSNALGLRAAEQPSIPSLATRKFEKARVFGCR